MSTRQPPRFLGALFALLASVLLVLSLILPLFVARLSMPELGEMTTTISAWGFANDRPQMSDGNLIRDLPAHAFPMVFAALMLIVATVIAVVRARSAGQSAARWLAVAAAFVAGVAISVVPQVTSWFAFYRPLLGNEPGVNSGASIGLGFWALAAGAVAAVVAAALTAMPVRRPEAAETPARPAEVEPSGTA